MLRKIVIAVALAASLVACATPPNPLDATAREKFFVKNAEVDFTLPEKQKAKEPLEKPEYVAFKEDFLKRLPPMLESEFKNSPSGPQAVTFKVKVTAYNASILGGFVQADVDVVRISDGVVLGTYTKITGQQVASGGLIGLAVQAAIKPDVTGIMVQTFSQTLRARFAAAK